MVLLPSCAGILAVHPLDSSSVALASSSPMSPSSLTKNDAHPRCLWFSYFCSKGRKLGAVNLIALRNLSCAGRMDWRSPSSSGTPSIWRARSLVKLCRRVEISFRGSEEGALGRLTKRERVRMMVFSSSSWIWGSLHEAVVRMLDDEVTSNKPLGNQIW